MSLAAGTQSAGKESVVVYPLSGWSPFLPAGVSYVLCFKSDFADIGFGYTWGRKMSSPEKSRNDSSAETLERAKEWIKYDPNPATRDLTRSLLASSSSSSSMESLVKFFGKTGRIGFGTAGLRGPMIPGPYGLNDLVVIQATQGIARYCQQQSNGRTKYRAVIGYDHRCNPELGIDSYTLACYAVAVLQEAGFDVLLLSPTPNSDEYFQQYKKVFTPTPLVAFSTLKLECSVGIMITASHNPKQDNGYKVFWSDGCQIRSPVDEGIANQIEMELIPWRPDYYSQVHIMKRQDASESIQKTRELVDQYFIAMKSTGLYTGVGCQMASETAAATNPIKIAYTAMHGVGAPWVNRAFHNFNLPSLIAVPNQEYPDPAFPTVNYPNPEEVGALSFAMKYAEQQGCYIVLANDPDADRLAVAEYIKQEGRWEVFQGKRSLLGVHRVPCSSSLSSTLSFISEIRYIIYLIFFPLIDLFFQGYVFFFGSSLLLQLISLHYFVFLISDYISIFFVSNKFFLPHLKDQLGSILGYYLFSIIKKQDPTAKIAMCASTVSSRMLSAIAEAENFTFVDTLPGFKHIGAQSQLLRSQGYRVIFSYEEALGYCCGEFICDKDGITAAAIMGELLFSLYLQEMSLKGFMQSLYDAYGEFVSSNGYYFCYEPEVIVRVLNRVRNGGNYIKTVAGYHVDSIRDLGIPGFDSTKNDCKPVLPTSASSPLLTIRFRNGCVFHFRPSGTEPKFKYYIEKQGKPGVKREIVLHELEIMKAALLEELFQPTINGLVSGS